eukprot:scaffold92922_cov29-Tisochrysis_lutea.AAC.1
MGGRLASPLSGTNSPPGRSRTLILGHSCPWLPHDSGARRLRQDLNVTSTDVNRPAQTNPAF